MKLLTKLVLLLLVCWSPGDILSVNGDEPVFTDWPCWRGPNGDNHASIDHETPLRWNLETGENVIWKTPIPGRGHSTPVLVGDAIFLTTSEQHDQSQSLLKLDRENGQLVDRWVLHSGTLPEEIHPNNSYASPTPAFDGENLLVNFHTDDAIWLTSITTNGRENWKKKVADFKPQTFQFGYGASPLVEDDLVIVAAEYNGPDSGLYAFDLRTGEEVWKVARPSNLNFASPIAATIAGQRQVMLAGANRIDAYDPRTGKQFWSVESATEAICGTVVWDGRRVLVSGGNPKAGTWCVAGDGTEAKLWDNGVMCYEQSLLTIKDYVFALADNGVAHCWNTRDGVEMWKERLGRGPVSASPLLASGRVYFASQAGTVYVVTASPNRFDLLAENPSGDSLFATPVAIDNRIYLRPGFGSGADRQEYLVAIGRKTR